jgi:hypothetical protein
MDLSIIRIKEFHDDSLVLTIMSLNTVLFGNQSARSRALFIILRNSLLSISLNAIFRWTAYFISDSLNRWGFSEEMKRLISSWSLFDSFPIVLERLLHPQSDELCRGVWWRYVSKQRCIFEIPVFVAYHTQYLTPVSVNIISQPCFQIHDCLSLLEWRMSQLTSMIRHPYTFPNWMLFPRHLSRRRYIGTPIIMG